jgi:bacterioferritin-associated ferredoxin
MAADTRTVLVSGCICKATSFAELLPRARAADWDLADIIRETGCGGQCGLCRPYLTRMLRTGETEFYELLPTDGI